MSKLRLIFLICLIFTLSLTACNNENVHEVIEAEPVPPRVYTFDDLVKLELKVDREEITVHIGDTVSLTAIGTADDGTVISDLPIIYYADGEPLDYPYFFATKTGKYSLYAECGSVKSESVEIYAHNRDVVSSEFQLTAPTITVGSKMIFDIKCFTEAGKGRSYETTVTINGITESDVSYEMTEKGIYTAFVTCGDVDSPKQVFSVVDSINYDMTLSADKTQVSLGETVKLGADIIRKSDGNAVSDDKWSIFMIDGGEVDSSYTFDSIGLFSFYAECDGEVSNTVTVEVIDPSEQMIEGAFTGYTSSLPAVVIDTNGKAIGQTQKVACKVSVYGSSDNGANYGDLPELVTLGEIKIRGQSSLGFDKKQYSLHTVKEDGSNNNIEFLGLPKENDWVLNGSYADKSLIRNSLAQSMLSKVMDYTCRTQYCEVYLRRENGSLDYLGVYTLIEGIKIDKNRLNIDKLTADDSDYPEITGGYIVSLDKVKGDENTVGTKVGTLTIVKPSSSNITEAQDAYIKNFLTEFATVIRSDLRDDPDKGITAYADIESFAAPLLITELLKNIDGFAISTYMYKERDGLLHYGPGWDYDLTLGNADYNNGRDPYGWYVIKYSSLTRNMMRSSALSECVVKTWKELRNDILSDENLNKYIDEQLELVGFDCISRSCSRWTDHWSGKYVWPNYNEGEYFTATHAREIDMMRTFILNRAEWMDQHIDELLEYPY